MELCYETDRLQLRLLDETWAERVLQFYLNGKEVFEAREPDRPTNFYTSDYQTALLHYRSQMTLKMAAVRFWMFEKENPERIIGTISFQNILRSVYQSCQIGYKLDPHYWHHGYAREAVARTLSIVLSEFDLHRVEAW